MSLSALKMQKVCYVPRSFHMHYGNNCVCEDVSGLYIADRPIMVGALEHISKLALSNMNACGVIKSSLKVDAHQSIRYHIAIPSLQLRKKLFFSIMSRNDGASHMVTCIKKSGCMEVCQAFSC